MDENIDEESTLKGVPEANAIRDTADAVPDFGYCVFNRRGTLYRPEFDATRSDPSHTVTWPDDAPFAVCLTHDVDHVTEYSIRQSGRRLLNTARLRDQRALDDYVESIVTASLRTGYDTVKQLSSGTDPLHRYERWLDLESTVDAQSTFFFMADRRGTTHYTDTHYRFSDTVVFDGERMTVADMIREIDRRGWEIGLHPTWPSYDDPDELRLQKERLESVLGHEIESIRQHYLHYDIRKTPRAHANAGFKYDSTLGFNDNVGFRFGTSYPWTLYDLRADEELPVLEVPLIVQDNALLNSSKGLKLDEETAFEYVQQLAMEVKSVGGVLTLLWHPSAVSKPNWWRLYERALRFLDDEGAWFGSVRDIGSWWTEKNRDVRRL